MAVSRILVAVVLTMTTLLLSLPRTTDANQMGPPVSRVASLCSDMTPQHPGSAQTTQPPYAITASATCYTPGQAVTGKRLTIICATHLMVVGLRCHERARCPLYFRLRICCFFALSPRRGAKYCDQHVCMSVCPLSRISQQEA